MNDFLEQGLTMDAKTRYLLVNATNIAERSRLTHELSEGSLLYATEALLASLLLSSQIKEKEKLVVQLQTDSPKMLFLCDINAQGHVRAKITPNNLPLINDNLCIDGLFFITKHNEHKELYQGVTEIRNERIQSGLHRYFKTSGQIDCLIRISFDFNDDFSIKAAQGLLIERLPESPKSPSATSEEFYQAYDNFHSITDFTFRENLNKKKICGFDLFPLRTTELEWQCTCSEQRIENMLRSLGANELRSIAEELGKAEVVCEFCNTKYHCSKEKLEFFASEIEEKQ